MFVYQRVNEMDLHYIIYKISFEGLIVELPFLFGVPMEHEKDHPWRSVSKRTIQFFGFKFNDPRSAQIIVIKSSVMVHHSIHFICGETGIPPPVMASLRTRPLARCH